jgi:L-fuconolactonase
MTLSIVDAHQHYWDLARFSYPWMTPDLGVLERDYLPADLEPILTSNGVRKTVVVQAISSPAETDWLLDLAARSSFIAGVVGWADLQSPDLGKELDRLMRSRYFKGLRHQVHDEPDDAWLLRADVQRGLGELERRGLPYDLLLFPRHLPQVPEVAERHPDLRLVIDHLSKPPIAAGHLEPWATDLRRAAAYPNVYCKLSGMATQAGQEWADTDIAPYVQVAVEAFGTARLMFGSDWPVCLLAGTYARILAALQGAVRDGRGLLSAADEARLFGGTATEFYKLS